MGVRTWLVAAALLLHAITQQPAILRIKVTIVDADQQTRPVPRHGLLISENPTSAAPQLVVTANDGTAEVRLKPGNYTVESDQPLIFQGKAYEWTQTLDVPAGPATTLDLTAANAQVEAAGSRPAPSSTAIGEAGNASALLLDWQTSVVTIWSPTRRGGGFLFDARGLIATNQRLAGLEKTLEVQLSPTVKVTARVLAADPDKNVAILWIDPKVVAGARPMKLRYTDAGPAPAEKEKLFTFRLPVDDEKSLESGTLKRVSGRTFLVDIGVDDEELGTPLFNAAGEVIAITTPDDSTAGASSDDIRAVRIDDARSVIAAAEKKMSQTEAPDGTKLPVEAPSLFPDDPLKEAARARKGIVTPYHIGAEDFDVNLITPLLITAARHGSERTTGSERGRGARDAFEMEAARRALQDFGNWWDYVRRDPPVLMIRATPKMVESLWKSILRGAAQTQGVSLPPIKRIKAGFARMQIFCGEVEVTPIHPFKIEHRIGDGDAVYEGFYVVDPAAVGPQCGTVKLTLFSDKAPGKGDTRVIDPKIVEQIWQDFAPYRRIAR
jgi:S1-C subfamily serine protease